MIAPVAPDSTFPVFPLKTQPPQGVGSELEFRYIAKGTYVQDVLLQVGLSDNNMTSRTELTNALDSAYVAMKTDWWNRLTAKLQRRTAIGNLALTISLVRDETWALLKSAEVHKLTYHYLDKHTPKTVIVSKINQQYTKLIDTSPTRHCKPATRALRDSIPERVVVPGLRVPVFGLVYGTNPAAYDDTLARVTWEPSAHGSFTSDTMGRNAYFTVNPQQAPGDIILELTAEVPELNLTKALGRELKDTVTLKVVPSNGTILIKASESLRAGGKETQLVGYLATSQNDTVRLNGGVWSYAPGFTADSVTKYGAVLSGDGWLRAAKPGPIQVKFVWETLSGTQAINVAPAVLASANLDTLTAVYDTLPLPTSLVAEESQYNLGWTNTYEIPVTGWQRIVACSTNCALYLDTLSSPKKIARTAAGLDSVWAQTASGNFKMYVKAEAALITLTATPIVAASWPDLMTVAMDTVPIAAQLIGARGQVLYDPDLLWDITSAKWGSSNYSCTFMVTTPGAYSYRMPAQSVQLVRASKSGCMVGGATSTVKVSAKGGAIKTIIATSWPETMQVNQIAGGDSATFTSGVDQPAWTVVKTSKTGRVVTDARTFWKVVTSPTYYQSPTYRSCAKWTDVSTTDLNYMYMYAETATMEIYVRCEGTAALQVTSSGGIVKNFNLNFYKPTLVLSGSDTVYVSATNQIVPAPAGTTYSKRNEILGTATRWATAALGTTILADGTLKVTSINDVPTTSTLVITGSPVASRKNIILKKSP